MFLKILIKALRNNGIYNASHLRVTQLGFGLALKLRLTNLQADNTGQALTNILTTEISLIILDNIILAGIIVPGSGQGNFKACQMSTALLSVNIINKAINIFLIAVIVLKGNLHHNIILGAIKINRLWIQNFLLLVEMLDKRTNTSIVMESFIFAAALIMKMDSNLLVQESQLPETMLQGIKAIFSNSKNFLIRQEVYTSTSFLCIANNLHRRSGYAPFKGNGMNLAVTLYLYIHIFTKGIYNRDTYTMQTTRNLVAITAKFTAGMKHS